MIIETSDTIDVLICDDSALMRNLISKIVDAAPGIKTCGTAMNGKFLVTKIPLLKPDIIVLDIEMPEMNGVDFLKWRKENNIDIPVIMLSSIAKAGSAITMQCLELGAVDFVTKPGSADTSDLTTVSKRLTELLFSYGKLYAEKKGKRIASQDSYLKAMKVHYETEVLPAEKTDVKPIREHGKIEVVAIGISTGGPNALREVFAKLSPDIKKPMLVVQHMPKGFTKEFAGSLNKICPLEVKEAQEGDLLKPGRILIAPGDYHITVEKMPLASICHVNQDPPCNGHRPSADILFKSIASVYENKCLGIIMTGMGRDGAKELCEIRKQGGWTLGQDEKSCIVYGMPKVAFQLGAVEKQVSLENMADEINRLCLSN